MNASLDLAFPRPRNTIWAQIQMPLAVSIAYLLTAQVAYLIGSLPDRMFTPFWPSNIVLFCALLITPPSHWWRFLLAVFPAHVISEIPAGTATYPLIAVFVVNCAAAATNACGMQWLIRSAPWLDSLRKAVLYVLTTALASPALWAFVGALVPILDGGALSSYWTYWAQWFAANAFASLTLGPLALFIFASGRKRVQLLPGDHTLEFIFINTLLILACMLAFQVGNISVSGNLQSTILYLPLPFILWSAVRFGGHGVSFSIFFAATVSIWRGLEGSGPFVTSGFESSAFALQAFFIALAAPLILLGGAVDEVRHAEAITREA